MLRQLRIENLVLAREVLLEFDGRLNLITGETGAGKSLIVNAVALALGGRSDAGMVRQGEERAVVEALFDLSARPDVQQRLAAAGYEQREPELLVKREVTADGRSRAFLSGQSVTVAMLRELTQGLVEMHGQHESQTLFEPATHRAILDRLGGLDDLVADVRRANTAVRDADAALHELSERAQQRVAKGELLRYRLAEYAAVKPLAGEEERLRAERDRLRHAEEIGESLAACLELLHEGEGAAVDRVHAAARRVRTLIAHVADLGDLADRLDDARTQLQEIAADLRSESERIAADPGRLAAVEDRLVAIERLRRRFDGASIDDVMGQAVENQRELDALSDQDESAERLARERAAHLAAYTTLAARLTQRRAAAATQLSARVQSLLSDLAMPHAALSVDVQLRDPVDIAGTPAGSDGVEQLEFLLAANPGEPARPLRKVASGGEISRVMLALDIVLEGGLPRRTLLFDEVDQGLGGEAAGRLGEFLERVSANHQVICITHLPQVAVRGERHIHVTKKLKAGRTVAVVKVLDDQEDRIEEVARMLGGTSVTDAARRHAEELIRTERSAGSPPRGPGVSA